MTDYNSTEYDLNDPKIKALSDELWMKLGQAVGEGMTVPEAFYAMIQVVCRFVNKEDDLTNKQEMIGQVAGCLNGCLRLAKGKPAVGVDRSCVH